MTREALDERSEQADEIIKTYTLVAMGCGVIPVPLLDLAAVLALEVKMVSELARTYAFDFPGRLVSYKMIFSMVASFGPLYFAQKYKNGLKALPIIGHAITATFVLTNGIAVYALGKVFQKHFESGGTFLSRDKTQVRGYFKEKFEEGKQTVPQWIAAG